MDLLLVRLKRNHMVYGQSLAEWQKLCYCMLVASVPEIKNFKKNESFSFKEMALTKRRAFCLSKFIFRVLHTTYKITESTSDV